MYQHRIALIRHGQTEWSASGQHTSTTDIDLTDEGVHQAMTIPSLLWGLGLVPTTVWSSPRLRAQRTATLAGLQIDEIVDDLAEWRYGEYEGITSKQIRVGNPSWSVFTQGAPGGESPGGGRRPRRPGAQPAPGSRSSTVTSRWSVTATCPGRWPCGGSGCRSPPAG